MRSFREYLPSESYNPLRELSEANYQRYFNNYVVPAFSNFFLDLVATGKIAPMDSKGYEVPFMWTWNDSIKKDGFALSPLAWELVLEALTTTTDYESFVGVMDRGNYTRITPQQCLKCGEYFIVQVRDWVPVLLDKKRNPAEPLPSMPAINELDITFNDGNLLIADWFNISEFEDAVERPVSSLSLNTEMGRIQATQHYASHGFVSVCVGNSCPKVWKMGDALVVGRTTEIEDAPPAVGSICTDLWWASIIERSQLAKIIASQNPEISAQFKISQLLKTNPYITALKVEPGTYRLYYSADPETFTANYNGDVKIPGVEQFFVLKKLA